MKYEILLFRATPCLARTDEIGYGNSSICFLEGEEKRVLLTDEQAETPRVLLRLKISSNSARKPKRGQQSFTELYII